MTNGLFTVLARLRRRRLHRRPAPSPGRGSSRARAARFTALTPRQLLAPVPYALYAANAPGRRALLRRLDLRGLADHGPDRRVHGGRRQRHRRDHERLTRAAIHAETSGSGVAVEGLGTTADGEGGKFITSHPSGTALQGIGAGSGSTALEVNNGAIKVAGTTRPAFVHEAKSGTTRSPASRLPLHRDRSLRSRTGTPTPSSS